MPKTDKPVAFSYLRYSSPEQGLGDSERRQTSLVLGNVLCVRS